ncbi:MAG TPA: ATPase domain-containing protein, partial [Thermoplasmata archaeon]|nr:ATPase domain-containing protein [Thermoplasmata archaeon]
MAPLDAMLMGGLLPGRPYLIVGPSGTGKTSLALQFLIDGVRRGERCLLVTLEEPPNEVRQNHRGLLPELDRVFVFDAIPDVMRYERAPFKDIAQVRESVPFGLVPPDIRKTAELASVEVTFSALEQTLKMELARRGFSRIVVDSLTALQYFCMKGFDETLGAQTFLRFLSDLRITTILTVEAPLEDVETPERLLARGEIRLFRWELDGRTVRAMGVEKFRGSQHDARLHPYRISSQGIDINLDVTISRDTRQVIRPEEFSPTLGLPTEPTDGLARLEQDTADLASLGLSPAPVLEAVDAALKESRAGRFPESLIEIGRARGLVLALFDEYRNGPGGQDASVASRRLAERVASVRAGVPPTAAPAPEDIGRRLEALSNHLHSRLKEPAPPLGEPPAPRVAPGPAAPAPGPPSGAARSGPLAPTPLVPKRPDPPPLPSRRAEPTPPRPSRSTPMFPAPPAVRDVRHPPLPASSSGRKGPPPPPP